MAWFSTPKVKASSPGSSPAPGYAPTPSNVAAMQYDYSQAKSTPPTYIPNAYSPAKPMSTGAVLGASTKTPSAPAPQAPTSPDSYIRDANQSNQDLRQMELDAINAEYEQESGRLSNLENSVKNIYGEVSNKVKEYFPQFQQLTGQQEQTDLSSLENTKNERIGESKSAMNKARALLSELQRRQMAYMSATGNYSSSTADAFGEQFGRQAFSQLSDIQGQRDAVLRKVGEEVQKVKNFYSEKILQGKQKYDEMAQNLSTQFLSQIDQIKNAMGVAASAKRQATVDAWRNYTNAKLQLDNQLFTYKTQYDQWKAEMDQNLRSQAQVGSISNVNPNFAGTEAAVSGVGSNAQIQGSSPLSLARTISDEDKLKLMQQGSLPFAAAQSKR